MISALTFVLLVATVYYAHKQWQEANRSAQASEQSAYAACENAVIARRTLLEIQSGGADTHNLALGSLGQAAAVTRAEAAQIVFDRIQRFDYRVGEVVKIPVVIKNVGKSAALEVHVRLESMILKLGDEPQLRYYDPPITEFSGILFPDEPAKFFFPLKKDRKDLPMDLPQLQRLEENVDYLATWGKIRYTDIFGEHHWITFCTYGSNPDSPQDQHKKCAAYNRADGTTIAEEITHRPRPLMDLPSLSCQVPKGN